MAGVEPLMRWVRWGAASLLVVVILACVFHQGFQFAARFLPSTRGTTTGIRDELAEHTIASVHGKGFRVPATRLCVLADRYRYIVGGTTYEAARVHLEVPVDPSACGGPPPPEVDVSYVPWAPGWAAPAPELSPILWLFLLVIGMPLLVLLTVPGLVVRRSVAFLQKLRVPDHG